MLNISYLNITLLPEYVLPQSHVIKESSISGSLINVQKGMVERDLGLEEHLNLSSSLHTCMYLIQPKPKRSNPEPALVVSDFASVHSAPIK